MKSMFFKKTKKISLHLRKIMNFEETTAILLMARAISQNLPLYLNLTMQIGIKLQSKTFRGGSIANLIWIMLIN
jgi:hypothetical protein